VYVNSKDNGIYMCAYAVVMNCSVQRTNSSQELAGQASLTIRDKNVEKHSDWSYGMHRTEVTCSKCEAHLGHVINDGH
jgi:peptide-methionine (R)-S-oxide reductase